MNARFAAPLLGLVSGLLLLPAEATAGRVKIVGVKASSTYTSDSGTYDPKRVSDGKISTAWVEGDDGSGLGAWVELDLGGEVAVEKIKVWGGIWYSTTEWDRSNRPSEIELKLSDESTEMVKLGDAMEMVEFSLKGKRTSTIRLRLKGAHSGTVWLDTGISEVQVFDATPGQVPIRGATASSRLDADADGHYEPSNLSDGITDTMWCEGSKEGDGVGEWVEFQFGSQQRVSKLSMVNGIATSLPFFMKGNRATGARLSFSDGSTETVTVKNSMLPQTISFPAKTTSSVKISFTSIAKGKEYNDLCIAEAYFSP
jgi:hypothetical protein